MLKNISKNEKFFCIIDFKNIEKMAWAKCYEQVICGTNVLQIAAL